MSAYVGFLLRPTFSFLEQSFSLSAFEQNQFLYLLQILYKNLEWAVDVDPEVI